MTQFNLWAFGDAHVGTDLKQGRESLADAIRQSEAENGFPWDIAIDIGDMSGGQRVPEDEEGTELARQFSALAKHHREDIYSVCGNHDRSGLAEPEAWWWRKWVDPTGEHSDYSGVQNKRRPYAVEGTWERYSFRVGNLLFLMMSDINEPTQTIGRGDLGGNPAGVVRRETFDWWRAQVEANPDAIIISAHHYMLKDTTVASGEFEGFRKGPNGEEKYDYHGHKPQGAPKGASYLYFVGSVPDAQAFEGYLAENPGRVAFWVGGHTHAHPDDTHGGKSHIETKWGTHFINCSGLTRFHGMRVHCFPKSRVLTFEHGSDDVRVRLWMHTDHAYPVGFHAPAERTLKLPRPFLL